MSDEGGKVKPGVVELGGAGTVKPGWNSNTPFPKLHPGDCPAKKAGGKCDGENCRLKLKGCAYRILAADNVTGRHAVIAMMREKRLIL